MMRKILGRVAVWIILAVLPVTTWAQRGPGDFIPPGRDRGECGGLNGGFTQGPPDPGGVGPFDVGQTEYNLSVGGFSASVYEGEDVPIEERAAVFYPRPLACGPFPVVLIMHGGHGTCYDDDS